MSGKFFIAKDRAEHKYLADWLKGHVEAFAVKPNAYCCGIRDGDRICMVTAYTNPMFNRLEVTWAVEDIQAVTRGNIVRQLGIPFLSPHRCAGLIAFTDADNDRAVKWMVGDSGADGCGFKYVGRLKGGGTLGQDVLIYELLLADWIALQERWRVGLKQAA